MQRESHELEEFEAFEARLPVLIVAQITGRVLSLINVRFQLNFNPRRYRFRRQKMSLEVSTYSQCPRRDELMYVQLVDVAVENVIIIRSIRLRVLDISGVNMYVKFSMAILE